MADERLRLVLDLQNKASKELQRIQRDLGAVKPGAGMKNTASWFQQLESASGDATKAIRPLTAGLNTIGVSGLAAGLSITSLIGQFRDLAKAAPALQELSRQTGMTKTQIERLKYAARNLSIDPSKMTASLDYFSGQMVLFHKRTGPLFAEMQHGAAGLAEKIRSEDPAEGYKDMLRWLAAIPDAQMRAGKSAADAAQIQKHWIGEALGDEGLSPLLGQGMDGFNKALADAAKNVAPITDALVAESEKLNEALNRFDTSWDNLKRDLGTTVLPGLTAATDEMRALFDEVKQEPALLGVGAAAAGALYARRRIMAGSKIAGGAGLDRAAGELTGAAGALKQAAAALEGTRPGGGVSPGGDPTKPGGTSFDSGRALLAAAGLAGLVANAPGMDAAGDRERDANASALGAFGEWAKKWTGAGLLEGMFNSGGGSGGGARQLYSEPSVEEDRATRARSIGSGRSAAAAAFVVPDAYNREAHARAGNDGQDHTLDGVVVGALGQEIIHLTGTLKTAAAAITGDGIRPAAFHPAGFGGGALDPQAVITAGTKEGVLSAFRELAGMSAGGQGGIMAASFGGGGIGDSSSGGGRRAPSLRYGRQHSSAPFMDAAGGADGAAVHDTLKDLISQHETGTTGAGGYDTAYGHAEKGGPLAPPKPLTQMTIAEVLAYQRKMKPLAHSSAFPVGRAQWTESTLRGLTRGMDPSTVFSPEVQEKLFDRSIAGRMGQGVGGFRSEWDSLRGVSASAIQGAIAGHKTGVGFSGGAGGVFGKAAGINPVLNDMIKRASEITGTQLSVYSGMRSLEHNRAVGGAEHSLHMRGLAADLTAAGHPKKDRAFWEQVDGAMAQAAREYHQPYRWGGRFPGRYHDDNDHFDLTSGGPSAEALAKVRGEARGPAIAPMPKIAPEAPSRPADGVGQRVQMDPLHIHLTHQENGRTRVAAKHGEGVKLNIRTAPMMVMTM